MNLQSWLKKGLFFALVLALLFAALPTPSASAKGLSEGSAPPDPSRLEKVWARERRIFSRVEKLFTRGDTLSEKILPRLDKADARGLDTAAVRQALSDFEASLDAARPSYEAAAAIIAAHEGFDAEGKVTDAEQARETVQSLAAALKEIRAATLEKGRSLRQAIRALREEAR